MDGWIYPSRNDRIINLARQQHPLESIAAQTGTDRNYVRKIIARARRHELITDYVINLEETVAADKPNKVLKALALIAARESGLSYAEIARHFWFANAAQARNAVWRARQINGKKSRFS